MYISDGGAPPPLPFTTDSPDYLLDTTFPVLDTTGSPNEFADFQTTAMPFWEVNPTLASLDWLKALTGPMINFGSVFETNRQNQPVNSPIDRTANEINRPVLHQAPGISQSSVLTDGKTGVHTLLDISMYIEKLNSNLKQNHQPASRGDNQTCHPFPLCGPGGCSSTGLSFFISFELLLLVLIVFSNVAIITVLRDMANSNKRHFRSSNVFKLSLALADLLLGLSILPAGIQAAISALIDENFDVSLAQIVSLGTVPGIIFGAGAVIATIVAIWSILGLQFSLFLSIRFPVEQHCGSLLTPKRAKIATVAIWCMAVALAICLFPLGFSFGLSPASLTYSPVLLPEAVRNASGLTVTYVEERFKIPLYAALVWGLPFLLTLPLGVYLVRAIGKACKKLTRRTQASYVKRHPEQLEKRTRLRKDWEAALRILAVEVVFVLTFAPSIAAQVFYSNSDGCDPRANLAQFIAQFVLVAGSFLNLFVYHLMWKDFKTRLTALFCGEQIPKERNSATSFYSSKSRGQNTEQSSPVKSARSAVIVVTVDSPRSKI